MTHHDTAQETGKRSSRVKRDVAFMVRMSRAEKERIESGARGGGYKTAADYVRNRLFAQPSPGKARKAQRVDAMFTEQQAGELAVAVMHLYEIFEDSFEESGAAEKFAMRRRKVIERLGLEDLLGSGE